MPMLLVARGIAAPTSRSQSCSHTYLFCILSHGFLRKRETARSLIVCVCVGGGGGGGLFRTSAKCSFHLFFTSSSFVSRMPSLLPTESVTQSSWLAAKLSCSIKYCLHVALFGCFLGIASDLVNPISPSLLSCFFTSLSLAWY